VDGGWWMVDSDGRATRGLGLGLRLGLGVACLLPSFDCLRCSTRDLAKIVCVCMYVCMYVLYLVL
jgi:hypothetical protein